MPRLNEEWKESPLQALEVPRVKMLRVCAELGSQDRAQTALFLGSNQEGTLRENQTWFLLKSFTRNKCVLSKNNAKLVRKRKTIS